VAFFDAFLSEAQGNFSEAGPSMVEGAGRVSSGSSGWLEKASVSSFSRSHNGNNKEIACAKAAGI